MKNKKVYIKKICGVYALIDAYDNNDIIEAFDTRPEAELAEFDEMRSWESLYDHERRIEK